MLRKLLSFHKGWYGFANMSTPYKGLFYSWIKEKTINFDILSVGHLRKLNEWKLGKPKPKCSATISWSQEVKRIFNRDNAIYPNVYLITVVLCYE